MDLIVNEVVELEVVHVTYGDRVVKRLAGSAVVHGGLTVNHIELAFAQQFLILFGVGLLIHADALVLAGLGVLHQLDRFLALDVLTGADFTAKSGFL